MSKQHTNPCRECPWRRASASGWLGGHPADDFIALAHSESLVACHLAHSRQCAGAAIYRGNVSKMPRNKSLLVLPADRERVFSSPAEFLDHHRREPVGKKAKKPKPDDGSVYRSAILSPCKAYRYHLGRVWDDTRGLVTFIMLNPSVADDQDEDPTMVRCINFAKSWGCGRLQVVNLFGLITPHPVKLLSHPDPVGPENHEHVLGALQATNLIVPAWGVGAEIDKGVRADVVNRLLVGLGDRVKCLGYTKDGHPRHPVRLGSMVPLELYKPRLAQP